MEDWLKLILAIVGAAEGVAALVLVHKSRAYSLVKEERDELDRKRVKEDQEKKELKVKLDECLRRPDLTAFDAKLDLVLMTQQQISRRMDGQYEAIRKLAKDGDE